MNKKQALASVLPFVKPHWRAALGNVISNMLATIFTILSFLVLKPFLDILFSNIDNYRNAEVVGGFGIEAWVAWFNAQLIAYIDVWGKPSGLVLVCGLILVLFFFKNLFRYLALYLMADVRNRIEADLRNAVMQHLLRLPLSYFSEERKGDLMARLTVDVQEIQWSVLRSIETLFRAPLALLASLLVMLYISPILTLFAFLLMAVVGLLIGRISRRLKQQSQAAQDSQGQLLSILDETLGGLRVVQAYRAEAMQAEKYREENDRYRHLMNKIRRRQELSSPLTEFLGVGIVLILLWAGGSLVFQGFFEASTFLTFVLMFYNIIDPAKSFASAFYDIQKGAASAARIQAILQTPRAVVEQKQDLPLKELKQGISFKNLSFRYRSDGPEVLSGLSFELKRGQTLALVGASGAGKSTIVDLLTRFYEPQQGEILLDGQALNAYSLQDLRGLICLVSQEAVLFNDTIFANIAFGRPTTQAQVEAAAKAAYAHDFIMATEQGYQTRIGDRGSKLSGGQKQRLSIARALLGNPQILILDEATSALDAASEKMVQAALENLLRGRTALIIAHRLSTIQHADEILVLQQGKVLEQGKHETLVQQAGLYAQLLRLQQN